MRTGGYDHSEIIDKTLAAMRKIVEGGAIFERDSVLLSKPEYPWPLIACLLHEAQKNGGRLSVLDFGGALGSSYYQCRPFFEGISELNWMVVEQKHYVEAGRRELSKSPVSFYEDVMQACEARKPNVLLLSSVLPYLPEPYCTFADLLRLKIPAVVVDRTPFLESGRDRLTIQVVPPEIYQASYPAWFFSRTRLLRMCVEHGYIQRGDWPTLDSVYLEGEKANWAGLWLEKTD